MPTPRRSLFPPTATYSSPRVALEFKGKFLFLVLLLSSPHPYRLSIPSSPIRTRSYRRSRSILTLPTLPSLARCFLLHHRLPHDHRYPRQTAVNLHQVRFASSMHPRSCASPPFEPPSLFPLPLVYKPRRASSSSSSSSSYSSPRPILLRDSGTRNYFERV